MTRWWIVAGLVGAWRSGDAAEGADGGPVDMSARPFERVLDSPGADVDAERLCAAVDEAAPDCDPRALNCAIEGFRAASVSAEAAGPVCVMAFHLEPGQPIDAILEAFAVGTPPMPDVHLARELDRGSHVRACGTSPVNLRLRWASSPSSRLGGTTGNPATSVRTATPFLVGSTWECPSSSSPEQPRRVPAP
jgi:hypothetical protein